MSELKFQEFFIKLMAEFPEMPHSAIWLNDYGTDTLAVWGQVEEGSFGGTTLASQGLGERITSNLGIGGFRYSFHFAKGGVFIVASIGATCISFVFDKVDALDETLSILEAVVYKLYQHLNNN